MSLMSFDWLFEANMCSSIQHHDYHSTTFNATKQGRRGLYLPCYPPSSSPSLPLMGEQQQQYEHTCSVLLLTNVPRSMLSLRQLIQRESSPCRQLMMYHEPYPSFASIMFYKHFSKLIQRLHVHVSIVDYNLVRLQSFIINEYTPSTFHRRQEEQIKNELDYDEMAIALEFFLQMDVDLFYMKTCSFRGAQPRSLDEGLFCKDKQPEVRYGLHLCLHMNCALCQSSTNLHFKPYQEHHFINGYRSILNCPATCTTANIVYVFTCPCGQYDFIGSTKKSFTDVILHYRIQLNRYIHERLTGYYTGSSSHLLLPPPHPSLFTMSSVSDVRLYEHTLECPTLLQCFLQFNPLYAHFLHLLVHDRTADNLSMNTNDLSHCFSSSLPFRSPSIMNESVDSQHEDHAMEQHLQPYSFLQSCVSTQPCSPNACDLYHMSILAVLPEYASCHLRTIIQALFILHAEPKLNQ